MDQEKPHFNISQSHQGQGVKVISKMKTVSNTLY